MNRSSYKSLSLFAFPVILFAAGILYLVITGPYFLQSVDPEYSYLLNGLLIADLKLHLSFIFHPGTPVQCIAAILIRIVHIFRPGYTVVQDVMLNPELYIKAILYTIIAMNALALYLMGLRVYKSSLNISVALFLQLTPFTHVLTLEVLRRLMPEPLMNMIVCGWISLIMGLIYTDPIKLNLKRYALLFGLLSGISLADKLTMLPFIIIPLILLRGWRYKLMYVLSSTGSFLLFAFPVTIKINSFYSWVKDIFMHTGSYGTGEKGIIKWNEFTDHLKLQFESTGMLKLVLLILFLVTVIYFLRKRRSRTFSHIKCRTGFALVLVIALEYLFASKHFAFHYMIPALLLTATGSLMVILMLDDLLPAGLKPTVLKGILTLAGITIMAYTTPRLITHMKQIRQITETNTSAFKRIEPLLKRTPKIISASYYGCASIEYALTCGIHVSGKYSSYLTGNLNELYPLSYLYLPWGKVFYQGNRILNPSDFIKPDANYNLYVADFSKKLLDQILNAFRSDFPHDHINIREMYVDSIQHEGVFLVRLTD
jgi:hypothetical protein